MDGVWRRVPLTSTEHVAAVVLLATSYLRAALLYAPSQRVSCLEPPKVRRVPSRHVTLCFGGAQSCRERSCAPTELYGTGGARIQPEGTISVSQALLQTERGSRQAPPNSDIDFTIRY